MRLLIKRTIIIQPKNKNSYEIMTKDSIAQKIETAVLNLQKAIHHIKKFFHLSFSTNRNS